MNRSLIARVARTALMLALAGCSWVHAQQAATGTRVLTGKDVTEANLVDALTPDDRVVTRSLRLNRVGESVSGPPQRKPSASLLITFETNSAELDGAARQQLDVVGAAMKNDKLAEYNFSLEGHADPRGTPEHNMLLSKQRAESVRNYLVSAHSIAPERLRAEGKGDREPLNRDIPAAAVNRRVAIVTGID